MTPLALIDELYKLAGPARRGEVDLAIENAITSDTNACRALGFTITEVEDKARELCSFDGGPVIYYP